MLIGSLFPALYLRLALPDISSLSMFYISMVLFSDVFESASERRGADSIDAC
jgi:hypothetical protein